MLILPLAPEYMKTHEKSINKCIQLLNGGEFNILKGLGLRDISFKFLLPKDNVLSKMPEGTFKQPIYYLSKLRQFIANKQPVRLTITRKQQQGEDIFATNILVSFEEYEVTENAGEEGCFWVDIKLKEFANAGDRSVY